MFKSFSCPPVTSVPFIPPRPCIKVSIGKAYYVTLFNEAPLYMDFIIFNDDNSISIAGGGVKQKIFDIDIKDFDSVWKKAYNDASKLDEDFQAIETKSRKSVAFSTRDDNGNIIVRIITIIKSDELNAAVYFVIDRNMCAVYEDIESCKDISLVGVNNIEIIPGDENSKKKCVKFFIKQYNDFKL